MGSLSGPSEVLVSSWCGPSAVLVGSNLSPSFLCPSSASVSLRKGCFGDEACPTTNWVWCGSRGEERICKDHPALENHETAQQSHEMEN